MSWLEPYADVECCDIITTGRRSGQPHEIEIWFGVLDGTMYLISGNGPTADWYRNLLAHPDVTVKLAGDELVGRARDITDPAERRLCGDLMGAKYRWGGDPDIGLTYDAWCYEVPAIAIEF
ncbi:MAG: nitroreductase family deazaflavin-dependent oxidoreductase [Ilumatobacter sp.]|uniref:nitroreductase family deazaflavin-dependent oxidoreductase n=1 Tax=Ilumatobacter sp. TaxID=1967498 RepID=UPI00261CF9C4|nr:nitroreductase family deazaflavin-dependent oxidoreductase [Ilumatobacter sp.]MDJ0768112.1 nitroreductase family deazaflavin-dependent oxidoreductase [Ilumatobacter sp.]